MRAVDGHTESNISATTSAFLLEGGLYGCTVTATFGGGSVKLQMLTTDATTYVSVSSGTDFTAAGYSTVYLPPGQYRWTIATASAIYAGITRIPSD